MKLNTQSFRNSCCATLLGCSSLMALEYAHPPADPQPKGWPLSSEERTYLNKPEHERRPGAAENKFMPELWPSVPFAQHWGPEAYAKHHDRLVEMVRKNQGPCDVLLVGDSITIQFERDNQGNENWKKEFPEYKAINIGIGGDRTSSVLWRLDHGAVDGLEPRSIVLMIGNNNMFFAGETGTDAIAKGIKVCYERLREQFPKVPIVLVKVLYCGTPDDPFYQNITKTNAALDLLKLESLPLVKVIDFNAELINADGTIKSELFTSDKIHLNGQGYALYAKHLRPVLKELLKQK